MPCSACSSLQVGAYLQDVAPAGLHSVFERFRAILHEGAIDKRCQYMIEGLFAVRKVRQQTNTVETLCVLCGLRPCWVLASTGCTGS